MLEAIAGNVAGDTLLGGAALCQSRYLRGTMAMCDPCWGRDNPVAGWQRKISKKAEAGEKKPYEQTHDPVLPVVSLEELGGTECEGW